MSRQVTYGQPKRLNIVSLVMLLIFLGGCYAAWRFVPPYFDAWSVDHVLKEGLTEAYRIDRMQGSAKVNAQRDLVEKLQGKIRKQAGVVDPDLAVELESDEQTQNVTLTAEYNVTVSHPVLLQPTHLHFKRIETTSLKRIEW